MTLELHPFGTYRVSSDLSSQNPGPVAFRSASRLHEGSWTNDLFGTATLLFGMGGYLQGEHGAHIQIRAAFEAGDGTRFFIEYISRGEMKSHAAGKTPVMLAGQIDIDPANARYAWLNHTQIVGRGMLTHDPLMQTYEMYALR
ncbi:hypothetical protein [Sphingomonas sp. KC8]|uniref:hypothetical protein n=1 Tax=Sphingomonas sp. KC8 TaxID=1030157 RepID=UPI0002488692|nr:hypothetical protein [Sphingomonas sp. KC8]ARS28724.1 hypothetical protein KC8_15695 [Sphingomonas sp. KC8]